MRSRDYETDALMIKTDVLHQTNCFKVLCLLHNRAKLKPRRPQLVFVFDATNILSRETKVTGTRRH